MTTPLQPAGAALESLEAAGRHVALLVAEIERKNALLRTILLQHQFDVSDEVLSAITKELTP